MWASPFLSPFHGKPRTARLQIAETVGNLSWKEENITFLKDENGSGNGQWMKTTCVKFYVSCLHSLSATLLLPPQSFLFYSFFPDTQPSHYLEKYNTKNDENLFCLLLSLGGKLLEGPPSFPQCVYTIYLNMRKHI